MSARELDADDTEMSPVYDKGPGGGYWYYLAPIAVMIVIVAIWLIAGAPGPAGY